MLGLIQLLDFAAAPPDWVATSTRVTGQLILSPWLPIALSACGGVLLLWQRLHQKRHRSPQVGAIATRGTITAETAYETVQREQLQLEKYVFAGTIRCDLNDLNKLANDHIFYLTIRIFNGAREPISIIETVTGFLQVNNDLLDTPPVIEPPGGSEPGYFQSIDRAEERVITIRQRVAPAIADAVVASLARDEVVSIMLHKMAIAFVSSGPLRHRLALPDGVRIQRRIGFVGIIASAFASDNEVRVEDSAGVGIEEDRRQYLRGRIDRIRDSLDGLDWSVKSHRLALAESAVFDELKLRFLSERTSRFIEDPTSLDLGLGPIYPQRAKEMILKDLRDFEQREGL